MPIRQDSVPGFPDLRAVADGGLLAVADNGRLEQLGVVQQLLLRRLRRDIGHIQILIGPALGVDQRIKAETLADAAVLRLHIFPLW